MVGFGLSLLGVAPQWNSRGIVAGLERQPLNDVGQRADTVFVDLGFVPRFVRSADRLAG